MSDMLNESMLEISSVCAGEVWLGEGGTSKSIKLSGWVLFAVEIQIFGEKYKFMGIQIFKI